MPTLLIQPDGSLVDEDSGAVIAQPVPSALDAVRAARKRAYPPLADLADALYWHANGRPELLAAYLADVAAVKASYPKPEAA